MPEEDEQTPAPTNPKPAEPSTPSGRGPGSDSDKPIAEMDPEERAEYFSRKADRLRDVLRQFDGLTPEGLAELKAKAAKQEELEWELTSDRDKAIAEARNTAAAEIREEFGPRLVAAEFKAAAAGRIEADRLKSILEPLDLKKFLDGDQVDTEKVAAYVDGLAPAPQEPQQRRGPSPVGAGPRQSSSGPSLQSGAELYQSRKGRRG